MIFDDVVPLLRELNRVDKLRAIQFLAETLTQEAENLLRPGSEYAIWSPYDAFEAAETLTHILESDRISDYE